MDQFKTQRQIAGIDYTIKELTTNDVREWLRALEQLQAAPAAPAIGLFRRWWQRLLHFLHLAPKPLPATKRDVTDVMLFEGFVMFDLRYLTSLTEDEIGRLTPRHLRAVWAECQEVNEDFFQMRRRLQGVGILTSAIAAEI